MSSKCSVSTLQLKNAEFAGTISSVQVDSLLKSSACLHYKSKVKTLQVIGGNLARFGFQSWMPGRQALLRFQNKTIAGAKNVMRSTTAADFFKHNFFIQGWN